MSAPLLTIFSAPKAFTGHNGLIQRNALRSWTRLPGARVLLLGDEAGIAETAEEFGCAHIPDIARSAYGTPLLNDIFDKARLTCETPCLAYVNADILLHPNIIPALQCCARRWKNFMLVGRRWDIELLEELGPENDWRALWETGVRDGELQPAYAIDFFVFPREQLRSFPPFIIGRPCWDNWLVYHTRLKGVPLIDVTEYAPALHQRHDYAHVPAAAKNHWEGSPEALINQQLAGLTPCRLKFACIFAAQWKMTENGAPRRNINVEKTRWYGSIAALKLRILARDGLRRLLGEERFMRFLARARAWNLL